MKDLSDRQIQIIRSSLELIAEKGIQGLTIKNLSMKIGISEPAIYRHYENKFDILFTILHYFQKESENAILSIFNNDDDAISKIEKIYKKHFNKFSENPSWVSVIFSEEIFRNEKRLAEKVSSIMTQNEEILIRIIKEGQAKRDIRDDADAIYLASIILGSLRLLVKKWEMHGYAFDLKQEGEILFNTIRTLIIKDLNYKK